MRHRIDSIVFVAAKTAKTLLPPDFGKLLESVLLVAFMGKNVFDSVML